MAQEVADLIVVPGAALWGAAPCPELGRRLERAAELHRRHPAAVVLCSGGLSSGRSEAVAMRSELRRLGVPARAILVDERGTSTRRTVRAAAALCPPGRRALFVSSDYHLRRVLREARRRGVVAVGVPVPVPRRRRQRTRELAAAFAYAVTAAAGRLPSWPR